MRSLTTFFTKGNNRSAIVKRNILGSLVVKGISILVTLLLIPLTLDYVSSELYGVWLTISSIMIWLNFFDIGFTLGLKNKLAESIALQDWAKGKSLVSTTYFMMIVIFLPLCILLEICVPLVNWASLLNIDSHYNLEIEKAMHILVLCFCTQMVVNILTTVISAYQQVALSSSFTVIGNLLSLIAIFFLTQYCPPSLLSLAFALSIMPIIVMIVASFILYYGKFREVSPSIKHINTKYIKELFRLGIKFFIIQIQMVIMYQSTNILISNLSGPNDVTAYNIAYRYISVALMLFNIILAPLWPAFTDAFTKKDYQWMNNIYKKMVKVYIISAICIVTMIAVSPIIYDLWIADKANIPFTMTLVVGIFILIQSWDSLQVMLVNGIGAVKLQTYITIIGIVLHIPLSIGIGQFIGGYGVILSMIFITTIYAIVFTTQIRRLLNQRAKGIWNQ